MQPLFLCRLFRSCIQVGKVFGCFLRVRPSVFWPARGRTGPQPVRERELEVLSSYRGVATGRYVKGEVRVYTLGAQPPTLEQVLARYRKMQEGLPGVLDWESRATALASGQARVAEADWISGDDTITLYPQGAWYQAATFPPR